MLWFFCAISLNQLLFCSCDLNDSLRRYFSIGSPDGEGAPSEPALQRLRMNAIGA
jgi:hypothetical protein